jgi:curved DNA-binding protein CbpA
MLAKTARRLAGVGPRAATRSPHVILGVSSDITEDKLKERYHELARTLHPDMPNGDAKRFKEVNAAYALLKAQRARNLREESDEGADGAPNNDPMAVRMREHMKKYQDERARGRPKTQWEMLWDDEAYEMLLLGVSWLLGCALIFDRWISRQTRARYDDLSVTATVTSGQDRPLPGMNGVPVPEPSRIAKLASDQASDAYFNRQRRSAQNFADLREFFLVHDTDFVTERRFTLANISIDRIDESKIPERCAIVKRINTTANQKAYDRVAVDLEDALQTKEWRFVDAGPTSSHTAEALRRIPKHNPSEYRLTFIEYHADTETAPRCMVAIVNDRYMPGTGKTQRAIVSGKEDFHARLALKRLESLRMGDVVPEKLLLPGRVPILDKKV